MNKYIYKVNDDAFLLSKFGQQPNVARNRKMNLIFNLLPWKNGYLR